MKPVTDAEHQIAEFTVYSLPDGRWRAVHHQDPDLTREASTWRELNEACMAVRIARSLRRAW